MPARALARCAAWRLHSGAAPGAAAAEALLADAVQRGDKQAVLALLKSHADVNAPQSDGATALHWAAYLEDAETTALLIRAGAKVDTPEQLRRDSAGARLPETATPAVIDQLLKAGANPNGACACRRDAADARGALRKRRRGEGAAAAPARPSTRRKPGTDRRR